MAVTPSAITTKLIVRALIFFIFGYLSTVSMDENIKWLFVLIFVLELDMRQQQKYSLYFFLSI